MKILFVCLGNICRSPLAEALFKHKVKARGLEKQFEIASCGTADYHVGEPPDSRTIRNARKNGIDINHLGRQLQATDLMQWDLIIPMDTSNYNNIFRLKDAEKYKAKIRMMRDFDSLGPGEDVPDPWSGGEKDFQNVFEILDRATEGLLNNLTQEN